MMYLKNVVHVGFKEAHMKKSFSIKAQFIVMYFFSFVIPIVLSMFVISTYLKIQFTNQTSALIDDHLESTSQKISDYLNQLDGLTIVPYYNKDFFTSLNTVLNKNDQNTSDYERFLAELALRDELASDMLSTRKDIVGTILVSDDVFVAGARKNIEPVSRHSYDFSKEEWYTQAKKLNGKAYVTGIHCEDYFTGLSNTEVFSIARLVRDPTTGRSLGVIMADADISVFKDIFSTLKFKIPSQMVLLDENNNVLFSTSSISKEIVKKINNNTTIKNGNESYNVKVRNIDNYNWKIAMLISDASIKSQLKSIYVVCTIFLILGLLITFFIFQFLSRDISIPIKKMMMVIKEVENGNFDVRVSKFKVYEIGELGTALNNMIVKLNESIEKEYKLVIQQKNAEFRALQSQINPHFLYNTLNGFNGLNRLGERELLEKSILNLTGMLRYALEDRNLVSINEEFKLIKEYTDLQLLRFEDRMNVNIFYDEKIKDYIIPKFLFQPIVENAIIHGVEPSEKFCTIDITGNLEGNYVTFSVSDNGVGFDVEAGKDGVGICNTKNRLLLFSKNSKFYIESSPNKGAHIKIMIPEEDLINENSNCR